MTILLKGRRIVFGALFSMLALGTSVSAVAAPNAVEPQTSVGNLHTAVFAGGCFWGVDAVFKHVKGVSEVESGYAGGQAATAGGVRNSVCEA